MTVRRDKCANKQNKNTNKPMHNETQNDRERRQICWCMSACMCKAIGLLAQIKWQTNSLHSKGRETKSYDNRQTKSKRKITTFTGATKPEIRIRMEWRKKQDSSLSHTSYEWIIYVECVSKCTLFSEKKQIQAQMHRHATTNQKQPCKYTCILHIHWMDEWK